MASALHSKDSAIWANWGAKQLLRDVRVRERTTVERSDENV